MTIVDDYVRFRNAQKRAARVRGSMNRSKYLWNLLSGTLERGTKAESRRHVSV